MRRYLAELFADPVERIRYAALAGILVIGGSAIGVAHSEANDYRRAAIEYRDQVDQRKEEFAQRLLKLYDNNRNNAFDEPELQNLARDIVLNPRYIQESIKEAK